MSRNEIDSALNDDGDFAAARRYRRATEALLRGTKMRTAARRRDEREGRDPGRAGEDAARRERHH